MPISLRTAFWSAFSMTIVLAASAPASGPASQPPAPVDLLARVDLSKDAVSGHWSKANQILTQSDPGLSKLALHYDFPAEYDLTLTFACVNPTAPDRFIFVNLPAGGEIRRFVFDMANDKTVLGFMQEGKDPWGSSGDLKSPLKQDQVYRVVMKVRTGSFQVLIDGDPAYRVTSFDKLARAKDELVGVLGSQFAIRELTVTAPESPVAAAPGSGVAQGGTGGGKAGASTGTGAATGVGTGAATGPGPDLLKPITGRPAGPVIIGAAQKRMWGKLTLAEQTQSVAELKAFAMETPLGKAGALHLNETRYFLFYSDLPETEATNWSGLLDRMYSLLAGLFDVSGNIFRGKALIFVFSKEQDYLNYQKQVEGVDARDTAGMTNSYGSGMVHISFFRQKNELEFAHILVHESTHGFVHRYRSPVRLPSWASEGLAEQIASELVPIKGEDAWLKDVTRKELKAHQGVGSDFFEVQHIAGWQYPIAESFTRLMINENRSGYVRFVNAIKDGTSVDEAMEKKYGASKEKIEPYFIDAMQH
jgi:hypothetical protein